MSNGKATKAYEVLKIDEMTRMSDVKGVERYYRATIKTRGGTVLTVDFDEKDYTPEKVEKILTQRAENSDKILML